MSTPQKDFKKSDRFWVKFSSLRLDGENERFDLGDIELLANSIKELGVLQDLTVNKGKEGDIDIWIVKDGSRRFTAMKMLHDKKELPEDLFIPCHTQPKGQNKEQDIVDRWILNDGKPFTPYEKSRSVGKLISYGWSQAEIAKRLAVSPAYISKLHSLYQAPRKLIELIQQKLISDTLAMKLLAEEDIYVWLDKYEKGEITPDTTQQDQQLTIEEIQPQLEVKPKRITQKTLDSNKINSYKSFKKFASSPNVFPDRIPLSKKPIYDFMMKVINDEVTELDFTKFFNED